MGLDLLQIWAQVRLLDKDFREQISCNQIDSFLIELDLARDYLFLNADRIVSVFEGHAPGEHFSYQNRKTPQVHLEGVPNLGSCQNFGRSVAYRTAVSCGAPVIFGGKFLGKAKIDQLSMTLLVYHNIFWLQISINYVSLVELVDGD